MKKYLLLLLILIPIKVYADEATEITKNCSIQINNQVTTRLTDGNVKTYSKINAGGELSVTANNEQSIKQLYIVYEIASKTGIITSSDGSTTNVGKDGFLHEYINLNNVTNSIKIKYDEDVTISEIRIFGEGETPKDVQKWEKEDKTDLMIFSTHADDEQLFFAGVMPTYINEGKKVHVVYLARHDVGGYYAPSRLHEQLDGLWTLGVTDYPTFGLIPDAYSESLAVAENQIKNAGFTDDDIILFDVKALRTYKPKVVLGHDENGEYGHGQHRLNTFTLKQAIEKSQDSSYVVEGLEAYSVPKFYIHLYDMENITTLNYDLPLEKYDGKTAYEVSKEGYAKHLSQQYTWFTDWLRGKNSSYTSATQITKYNPTYWGLYKSDVGPDVNKNDLFENIVEEKKVETIETDESQKENANIKKKKETKKEKIISTIKKNKEIIIISLLGIVVLELITLIFKKRAK